MTTIDTSTAATATAHSNQRKIDRTSDGVLWALHSPHDLSSSELTALELYYSTNDGGSWSFGSSNVNNGSGSSGNSYAPNGSLFIDVDDYCHVVYKSRDDGHIYYRRGTSNEGTSWIWSAAQTITTDTTADYPDVVAHREGSGWAAHVVVSTDTLSGGAYYFPVEISSEGSITVGASDTLGDDYGAAEHRYPSIDFHHTGDAKTVKDNTPHLFAGWSAGDTGSGKGIRFRKATYSGGSWSWATEREIDAAREVSADEYWLNCLFDGTRVIIGGYVWGSTFGPLIYERDADDTTTDSLVSESSPLANRRTQSGSMAYDVDGNIYLIGRDDTGGDGTRFLIYRKYDRSAESFGDPVVFETSAPDLPYASAKRGYAGGFVDIVYTDGTSSPYDVTYDSINLNKSPSEPTLTSPANGSAVDFSTSSGRVFAADFEDPDDDSYSAWAFRRRLDGGTSYEYWDDSTEGWGSTEVWNSETGTEFSYSFPSGSWSNSDTYNWSVAFKDPDDEEGPFASNFTVTGNTRPFVSVTDPGGTVTDTSRPTVEWNFSDLDGHDQAAYEVKVFDEDTYTVGGFDPDTSTAEYSSGVTSSSATQHALEADLANSTTYRAYVQVTDSLEGKSEWDYSEFTLSLTAPAAPTLTVTDDPDNGRVVLDVQGNHNAADFPDTAFRVERSDDDGSTWIQVRDAVAVEPDASLEATAYDYEAPPNAESRYRAYTDAEV